MPINELFKKRFAELATRMENADVMLVKDEGGGYSYNESSLRQWSISALHLLKCSLGTDSVHYQSFLRFYSQPNWNYYGEDLKSVFLAAKEDYEGGYLLSVQTAISGEIFESFIELAKTALKEDSKDVAAVLACAALEDLLKRFALNNGLDVSEKNMYDVINALKSNELLKGTEAKIAKPFPKIRDHTFHANWDLITTIDVNSVIGFVEGFLIKHFS